MEEQWFGWGLFIVVLYFLSSPNIWTSSKHTIYELACFDYSNANSIYECDAKDKFILKNTFLAIPEAQMVVQENGNGALYKYDNCIVMNAENWSCSEGESLDLTNIMMSQGTYIDGRGENSVRNFRYTIPRYEYYIRKMKAWLS